MRQLALFVIAIVALSAPLRGASQRPERSETGVIGGTITLSGTGEPLPGVEVRLIDTSAIQPALKLFGISDADLPTNADYNELLREAERVIAAQPSSTLNNASLQSAVATWQKGVLTDKTGHFEFNALRPGQYTINAEREGFFGGTANSASNVAARANTSVTAGGATTIDLSMFAGATISGRISSNGTPLVGVNVQAYVLGYENGYQILRPTVSKQTDDRGNYRLFYLSPGDYIVAVVPRQDPVRVTTVGTAPPAPPTPAAGEEQPLRTFYPNATDAGSSVPIAVQGSKEVAGIDIAMQSARTFRVSGEVRTAIPPEAFLRQGPALEFPGAPRQQPLVASPGPSVSAQVGFALHDPDVPDDEGGRSIGGDIPVISAGKPVVGRFEVTGITPGSYDWRAYFNQPTEDGSFTTTGIFPIEVRNSDVDNVQIEVPPIVRVTGAVTIDGRPPAETAVKVSLQVEGSSAKRPAYRDTATRAITAKKEDGSFVLPGIQNGRYRVLVAGGLARQLYVADVRQGPISVFDTGFEVAKGIPDPLQVILKSGAGQIEGVVRDADRRPVPGATVALVPPPSLRVNRARYQTATSDAGGRFTITNIIPGDYKLFAWPDAPGGAYFNAKFIARSEERGRPIIVTSESSATMDLVAILPSGK